MKLRIGTHEDSSHGATKLTADRPGVVTCEGTDGGCQPPTWLRAVWAQSRQRTASWYWSSERIVVTGILAAESVFGV